MTDILDRLNVAINSEDGYWPLILAKDAADEIQKLRAENKKIQKPKDLRKIKDKFTEIVAVRLDVFDQRKDGIWPPHTNLERCKRRYNGTPFDERPPYTIEINHFRIEIDEFVAMLMSALEETEK